MALYTSKAVAEVLGVTERRVRELRDEGVLSEERPGIFNMKTVVKQYLAYKIGDKDDSSVSRLPGRTGKRPEARSRK